MDDPEIESCSIDETEIENTALFLWKATNMLSTTCPAASRYYMSTLQRHIGEKLVRKNFKKPYAYCKYCGSLWRHLNYKIRIHPIPRPNRHIKKLMTWEREQPWKLNNRQKKKLKKYTESENKIIYTCNVCKKKIEFSGLKKYKAKEQDMSISTPASKIKLKKGDLNAGLYIRTPKEENIENKLMEVIHDDKTQNEVSSQTTLTPESTGHLNLNNPLIADTTKKNVTPQTASSNKKKRKKGLLAQILNQEQEAKRQKKTLSSFLTSL